MPRTSAYLSCRIATVDKYIMIRKITRNFSIYVTYMTFKVYSDCLALITAISINWTIPKHNSLKLLSEFMTELYNSMLSDMCMQECIASCNCVLITCRLQLYSIAYTLPQIGDVNALKLWPSLEQTPLKASLRQLQILWSLDLGVYGSRGL